MACPIDATTGFLEIMGQITPAQLKPIEVNAAPLTFQFAPRAVPPTLVGNQVEENPQNTLLYKSIRYELLNTQINTPTHTGYNSIASFLGPPVFEVNLTFFSNQAPKTYPSLILLVVPVYTSQEQYHGTYFPQLLDTDAVAVSIQSLFFDEKGDTLAKSFSYQTCIDLVGEGEETPQSLQARIFVFPFGASISQQMATNVFNTAATATNNILPPYTLDKGLIGDYSTVLTYQVDDDGNKIPTQTSNDGTVAQTPISPVSESFANLLQYYVKPPLISEVGHTSSGDLCGLPTTEYKCIPFDAASDLSGNNVVMGAGQTLQQLIEKQQDEQQQGLFGTASTGMIITLFVIGFIPVFILLIFLAIYFIVPPLNGFLRSILSARTVAIAAGAAAGAAVAAGGAEAGAGSAAAGAAADPTGGAGAGAGAGGSPT